MCLPETGSQSFHLPTLKKLLHCAFTVRSSSIRKPLALATSLGGCFIVDKQGHLLQSFTRKEGLQNNNILNIFLDEDKNLWLGLDNGIDFIAYNDAVKHIYTDNL